MSYKDIVKAYEVLKGTDLKDYGSDAFRSEILTAYRFAADLVNRAKRVNLTSQVPGKSYFSVRQGKRTSRAINAGLFEESKTTVERSFCGPVKTKDQAKAMTRAAYTIAISVCAAIDINKSNDQKTPGTFFELLVGHLMTRRLNVSPQTEIQILNLESEKRLPTDFIFDLGKGHRKYHVPVKTSTRERVIQVWAHQRVLDGVYGVGQIQGMLVALAETKVEKKSGTVVEICLPDQWRIYQMFIAQMKAAYYLDVPDKYAKLGETRPKIEVKPLGDIFLDDLDS